MLDGDRILGEDWYNGSTLTTDRPRYFYDAEGVAGMRLNSINYNFIRDAEGTVVAINKGYDIICEYEYDSFGKLMGIGYPAYYNIKK